MEFYRMVALCDSSTSSPKIMPDYIVCTRAIEGGSFSSGPRLTRLRTVLKLSNVKRIGGAPRAGRVGLPESAPAKSVGVVCGARFLKAHPTTLVVGCDRGPRATRYIFTLQVTGRDAAPIEQDPRRDPTITLEDLPPGAEVKLTVHTQNGAGDSAVVGPVVVTLV